MNVFMLLPLMMAAPMGALDAIEVGGMTEVTELDPCFDGAQVVQFESTYDGTLQPATWYEPDTAEPVPLLVCLHSFGGTCYAVSPGCTALQECKERGWALMYPNYRGSNYTPAGCASPEARQDILDAVAWARRHCMIDESRVYLFGGSAGGHMALIMAGVAPTTWAAVSAWVPYTDLEAWYWDTKDAGRIHWTYLEIVCGGPPEPPWLDEYVYRSSLPYVGDIACPVEVCTGILDGLLGSVPPHHTLWGWNILAETRAPEKIFDTTEIIWIGSKNIIPEGCYTEPLDEERYYTTLVHRTAGDCRVIISNSAHGTNVHDGCEWLSTHAKVLAGVDDWGGYQ